MVRGQHLALRHRLHGLDRGARQGHDRHLGGRPRRHHPAPPSTRRPGPRTCCGPGHVFPLRARRGGVLKRAGQTEASVDLACLAGLAPAGVICEIMNDDGTMARVPDLAAFAARARPPDHHRLRPHPLPPAARDAGAQDRLAAAAHALRRVPHPRLPLRRHRRGARGAGDGRRSIPRSRCWCASTASA